MYTYLLCINTICIEEQNVNLSLVSSNLSFPFANFSFEPIHNQKFILLFSEAFARKINGYYHGSY